MKKYICIFAAFAAVLSCQKEAPQSPSKEIFSAPATLEIINPMTKLGIGTDRYVWTEGDQILLRQHNSDETDNPSITNNHNVLSYSNDDNSSNFSGNLVTPYTSSSWYAFYPASSVSKSTNTSSSVNKITLPSKQSGTFEDYGSYKGLGKSILMLSIRTISSGSIKRNVLVDNESSEVSTDNNRMYSKVVFQPTEMKILTPVIKLTVPEGLNIKRITCKAFKNNGTTSEQLLISGASQITLSTAAYKKNPGYLIAEGKTDVCDMVEIYRDHNVISGDVYICIYPDDPATGISSANELYFKFEQGASSAAHYVEITKPITNQLTAGKVLDLGTVPTNLEFINPNASSQASVNFSGTVPSTTPAE